MDKIQERGWEGVAKAHSGKYSGLTQKPEKSLGGGEISPGIQRIAP